MQARKLANFNFSRSGRQRLYANIPAAADLSSLGLGLAADASQMLAASESSRQAILIGVGDSDSASSSPFATTLADLQALISGAPQVLSLNGSNSVAPAGGSSSPATSVTAGAQNGATLVPTMPQAAPRPYAGVYLNPAQTKGPVRPDRTAKQFRAGPPGCGLGQYPPAWSDAYLSMPAAPAAPAYSSGVLGWIQRNPIAALLVGIGGAVAIHQTQKRRRGR